VVLVLSSATSLCAKPDEYDQGVVEEYNEDPSIMVIFVSIFPYHSLQSCC